MSGDAAVTAWCRRIGADEMGAVVRALFESHPACTSERSLVLHDLDLLRARYRELAAAFPSNALHAVAVKANPLIEVLRSLVELGAGLEAASIEEVEIALAAGCAPDRIVFDSPAKTIAEIERCASLGVTMNADSIGELRAIAAAGSERYGLRLRPDVGLGSIAATSVGGAGSRFGVGLADVRDQLLPQIGAYPGLRGVHVHVGSQGMDVRQLVTAAAFADRVRDEIDTAAGRRQIDFVDIGGGLPTSYDDADTAPDIGAYAREVRRAAPGLFDDRANLVTEMGRSLLGGTAFAISRVVQSKPIDDIHVATTHLGADFLLRAAYAPDDWRHQVSALDPNGLPKDERLRSTTLAGPLCFAGDVIAREIDLPPLSAGDIVLIHDVGAYGVSMWSRHCSRAMPAVLGYESIGASPGTPSFRVLREPERPADVVEFWSRRSTAATTVLGAMTTPGPERPDLAATRAQG